MKKRRKINLYVDDLRDCPEDFVVARTVEEALYYMQNYEINILSLDHDLGVDAGGNFCATGYDLVKHMCEYGMYVEKIYIHTDNPVGRENMYQTLVGAQKRGFIDKRIKMYNKSYVQNKYTR